MRAIETASAASGSSLARFLWARFTGQVAMNALLYALLIAVVDRSSSSLASTVLVAAFTIPTILLGVPGGMVADALPRRVTLVGALVLRALIAFALAVWADELFTLYLLVLALGTVGQAYAPAEAAFIPEVVPAEGLARANAWSNFVLIAAQVLGGVALAPVMLKLAGARAVFGIAVVLFLVAAWQMALVRTRRPAMPAARLAAGVPTARPARLVAGWQTLRDDRAMFGALVRMTLLGMVPKVLIAVAPTLARGVLEIATANTVYVLAPAALGSGAGLLLVLPLTRVLTSNTLSRFAFVLFAAGVIALALSEPLSAWLEARPLIRIGAVEEITRVPTVVTTVMLLAVFLGMTFTLANVAIRTLLNERAPIGLQGRVFATQMTIAEAMSLLPLIAAGALVDHVGVAPVLIAVGAACLAGEALLIRRDSTRQGS